MQCPTGNSRFPMPGLVLRHSQPAAANRHPCKTSHGITHRASDRNVALAIRLADQVIGSWTGRLSRLVTGRPAALRRTTGFAIRPLTTANSAPHNRALLEAAANILLAATSPVLMEKYSSATSATLAMSQLHVDGFLLCSLPSHVQ